MDAANIQGYVWRVRATETALLDVAAEVGEQRLSFLGGWLCVLQAYLIYVLGPLARLPKIVKSGGSRGTGIFNLFRLQALTKTTTYEL